MRDECLNEHLFVSIHRILSIFLAWRSYLDNNQPPTSRWPNDKRICWPTKERPKNRTELYQIGGHSNEKLSLHKKAKPILGYQTYRARIFERYPNFDLVCQYANSIECQTKGPVLYCRLDVPLRQRVTEWIRAIKVSNVERIGNGN